MRSGMTNRERLNQLFADSLIALRPGFLFNSPPPALPAGFAFDRAEGMMLGLAIGDAMGITTEGMFPDERRRHHEEIRDYLANRYVHLQAVEPARGYPSDDTQMAFWTLEQLLADRASAA
jgi:hypothetical protein